MKLQLALAIFINKRNKLIETCTNKIDLQLENQQLRDACEEEIQRLRNENKQLQEPLPGCGTLICRTRLRDVYDTKANETNILIEGMYLKMSSSVKCMRNFS